MRQAQLNQQKISTIETMDESQLNSELKKLQLATYGNRQEKMKRLKKFHGVEAMRSPQNSLFFKDRARPKSSVVQEIEQMKQRREERRVRQEEIKSAIAQQQAQNEALGKNNTDV